LSTFFCFDDCHSIWGGVEAQLVLIFIFLVAKDVEHSSMNLLVIEVLLKSLFQFIGPFVH
jgi:hypothetical protein